MFERLTGFFQSLSNTKQTLGSDDPRIAAIALLFSLVDADGEEQDEEKHVLRDIVAREYAVAGLELKKLIEAGRKAHHDSIDIFVSTTTLNQHLSKEQRVAFIGLLWEIAFADGHVFELEDNLIWRIAELMGVERADRLALKNQVAQRMRLSTTEEDAQ